MGILMMLTLSLQCICAHFSLKGKHNTGLREIWQVCK